jgi:hypothetical protein
MEMDIVIKEWKMITKDTKQKTIGGTYQVKMGNTVVSESTFNDGYQTTDISIPADILAKVEAFDAELREAIIKNFTG